jgi:excisionase family DNA binding protein
MRQKLLQDPVEMMVDGLESVNAAARFLQISRGHVYNLMRKGELPFVKFGRSRRIPKRAMIGLAAEHLVVSK